MNWEQGSSLIGVLVAIGMVGMAASVVSSQRIMISQITAMSYQTIHAKHLRRMVLEQVMAHGLRDLGSGFSEITDIDGDPIDFDNAVTNISIPGNAGLNIPTLVNNAEFYIDQVKVTLNAVTLRPRLYLARHGSIAANFRKYFLVDVDILATIEAQGPSNAAPRQQRSIIPIYAIGDDEGRIYAMAPMGTFGEICMDDYYQKAIYRGDTITSPHRDILDRQFTQRLNFGPSVGGSVNPNQSMLFVPSPTPSPGLPNLNTFEYPSYLDTIDTKDGCVLNKWWDRPAATIVAWSATRLHLSTDNGFMRNVIRGFACNRLSTKMATEGAVACGAPP